MAFLLFSLFLFCAIASQQPYQCKFTLNTGGVTVQGRLTYDFVGGRMERVIYDNSGANPVVTELYQYDKQYKNGQFVQTTQESNSKCAKHPLKGSMPVLDFTRDHVTIAGLVYSISECELTDPLPAAPVPSASAPCPACRSPLDVVFVVDTSLSVCQSSRLLSKTVQDLTASYDLGVNAVHVGIVRFSWRSWVSSSLATGTGRKKITFPSEWPANCGNSKICPAEGCCKAPENDCLGTCVSCGIRTATDLLKSEGRPGVPAAIIVVTDGYHNMQYVATNQDGAHSTYRAKLCPATKPETGAKVDFYEECHPAMLADIAAAKQNAIRRIPGVQIFSYGQYTTRGPEVEFLAHTVTHPDNVYVSTESWSDIGHQTTQLAQTVCGSVPTSTCPGCTGFCSLGKCVSLTPRPAPPNYGYGDASFATDTTVVGEPGAQSSTTVVTNTKTSDTIPGWGVGLLALTSILIVLVTVNLVMKLRRG